ncbi:MAG: bifunctional folylpolyglutamate synthase/dihydrofolate synthase [Acidimicrobiales bacterium]
MAEDLSAALRWLDTHINYESAKGGAPKAGSTGGLSLERMHGLVDVLGEPQRSYPVIHITGTNGKGSVARIASAVLAAGGLTVGTYTSPHLEKLNERIVRNGEPIDDDELVAVLADLERLEPLVAQRPSYFELLTAAAFRWFADVAVDVAVVEVGLLGRYDATNVADGVVAVLTNVGHDHSDFTGDWRERIAQEKAGIVKPGATFVVGETDQDLLPTFERAGAEATWFRDFDFGAERNEMAVGGRVLDLRTPSGLYEELFLPLHGAHQGDNAACALAAVEAFFGQRVDDEVVAEGFAASRAPGRFEVVGHQPLVVLDGAHNVEGARGAIATLDDDFAVHGERIIVLGVLAPRDPSDLLDALEADQASLVVACTPRSPRAIPADDIAAAAEAIGTRAIAEPDVATAVERAIALAGNDDAVLVTGSLYVVGEARTGLLAR